MKMWILLLLVSGVALGCIDRDTAQKAIEAVQLETGRPDELPSIRDDGESFRYPASLFEERVQGNVTLRIHIDSLGYVVGDSTMVVESSGFPTLDTAAVLGSQRVVFQPARLKGRPVAMSILLPVYFRHPEAPPLAGDTILNRSTTPP